MKGHHDVQTFYWTRDMIGRGVTLESGWKPFAAIPWGHGICIVARRWVRD